MSYLDRQLVLRESGVHHHDEGEGEERLLVVLEKFSEVLHKGEAVLVEVFARNVHAEQPLIGVHLAMEFQHLLHILGVDDQVMCLLIEVLWHCERTVDVDLLAVYCAEECPNHNVALVLRLAQEVV